MKPIRPLLFFVPVLFLWLAGVLPGWAQGRVELTAVRDNTLFEDATGAVSNGAGDYLFAGSTNSGQSRRALIAFDVAGSVPAGARIDSVRLRLNHSRTIGAAQPVALHRVLAAWGEGTSNAPAEEGGGAPSTPGDATWIHASFNTTAWQTPGGDFTATPSASRSVGNLGLYDWGSTPEMVADVQAWLDQPEANHGWILVGNEAASATAKRFDSKEHPAAATRPTLVVHYATATAADPRPELPAEARVLAAYPNPFARATTLTYELDAPLPVRLHVYDLLGRQVATLADGVQPAGRHEAAFDAADLPAGIYLYVLHAGAATWSGRLVRLP